ncbi:FtsQ-type POTRA domain-containing protein [Streptomyces sp. TRM70308]|uniref:cell division protein FtsQ/DivIB n=1 Tax=Streptomyces sp. TRM70308 TaxID=3131932 RepID=UPI003D0516F3
MGGAAGPTTTADTRREPRRPDTGGPPAAAPGRLARLRPRVPGFVRRLRPPRRGRRGALILASLGVAGLVGFGLWALYGSTWLRVERVSVEGTRELTRDQVRSAADVPEGDPLAAVDTDAVAHRVTEALTRVAEVEVERDWPHGITLRVTERTPELVMPKPGREGTFVEVDAEGVRYAEVRTRPSGVPLLLLDAADTPSGQRFGRERLRGSAVRVVTGLPDAVRADTRTLRVRSYDAVTLELSGGRTVVWGSEESGRRKAEVLTALMRAERDATHFDVSVPSAPAASGG